ncbi:hypothetical protein Vretimale_11602 [Volvox reticuliferus]|nr:hypothetical protein Vretimale_11602 [Volvox reticuliferus]
MGWNHRYLPYGHTFFIENVVDPAHVSVSHHNIAGDRYKDPRFFHMDVIRPVSKDGGFAVSIPDPLRDGVAEAITHFAPPGCVRIEQKNKNGTRSVLALYGTPVKPGWTMLVGQQMMVEASGGGARAKSIVGFVGNALPQWLSHVLGALFLNQDTVFLHQQERILARKLLEGEQRDPAGVRNARKPSPRRRATYFMPGQADRGVEAWCRWLETYGGGDVPYAPGTPPLLSAEMDRDSLFDTWNAHTRHCTICLTALKRLQLARAAAIAVGLAATAVMLGAVVSKAAADSAAAAALAGVASAPVIAASSSGVVASALRAAGWLLTSWEGVAVLLLAAVAMVVVLAANKIEQMMHRVEYSHADNN